MGTLYLVATPIGNLEDITLRALRVLREVALIAAEDTRRTRVLLRHYEISTPLISYHAHNERARRDALLQQLATSDMALVSDAGTPGLSDPGFDLVRVAVEAGHPVVPVPGPSALLAATTTSGLVPDRFVFIGFLPRKAAEARATLAPVAPLPFPLVFYEAPHRLAATLRTLLSLLGDRQAVVARELTKVHEEFRRATLAALLAHYTEHSPRGECVLIVAGAQQPNPPAADEVTEILKDLLAQGLAPSHAAREAAQRTRLPRRDLYDQAMLLARLTPPRRSTAADE